MDDYDAASPTMHEYLTLAQQVEDLTVAIQDVLRRLDALVPDIFYDPATGRDWTLP